MDSRTTEPELQALRERVRRAIDEYVYDVPEGAVGKPCQPEWIANQLQEAREALVEPQWITVEIADTIDQIDMEERPKRQCIVVADDRRGFVLLFDPVEQSFVLAQWHGDKLSTFGVRGDAVGCFLSR